VISPAAYWESPQSTVVGSLRPDHSWPSQGGDSLRHTISPSFAPAPYRTLTVHSGRKSLTRANQGYMALGVEGCTWRTASGHRWSGWRTIPLMGSTLGKRGREVASAQTTPRRVALWKKRSGRTERLPPRRATNAIATTFAIPLAASMPALSGPDRPVQRRERRAPLRRGRTIPAGSAAPYETSKRGRRSIAAALAWTETLPYLRPVVVAACPWIASATFSSIPTSAEMVLNKWRQA